MAENSPTHVESGLTLGDLFSEIRQQRAEVQALRDEFKGASDSVACEVKRLKSAQEIKWKYQGNKLQHEFNSGVSDLLTQILWSVDNRKPDYTRELCNEALESIKKTNKLIRIADSSTGGWETVRQYETNPVASDSEDESRIIKAENRAIKRKRNSSRGRGSISTLYSFSGVPPTSQPWSSSSQLRPASGRGKPFRGHYGYGNAVFTPGAPFTQFSGPVLGPCFACGESSHLRRNCPHVVRAASSSVPGNQTQGGK